MLSAFSDEKGQDGDHSPGSGTRRSASTPTRGKHVYVDPFLTGNPKTPESREAARARRRDRGHARPRRPRRRRRRALAALPRRRDRLPGRAEGAGSRGKGAPSATAPRAQQGRHAGDRRHPLHARRTRSTPRAPTTRRRVPRRGLRVRDHARGRRADLLRRRHLRVRRHAADRAGSTSPTRGAADRRPLHDGARARPRSRSSCSATRAASRATGARSRS